MTEQGILKQNDVHLREHEFQTVKVLLNNGYDIELIPPSQIKGLSMPDIMMAGVPWEIKSPNGNSKNTIKHILQKAKHQSDNVIIDLLRCQIDESKAIKELEQHYHLSKRIRRSYCSRGSLDIK